MLWLTIPGLLFITLIPAATAIVGRFPGEKLAVACFSMNSFLQVLSIWFFLDYVSKNQKKFAADTDPRIMIIISQVWLIISAGWFISIFLGYLNVYVAYAAWVLLPNLVAIWGNHRRQALMQQQT